MIGYCATWDRGWALGGGIRDSSEASTITIFVTGTLLLPPTATDSIMLVPASIATIRNLALPPR